MLKRIALEPYGLKDNIYKNYKDGYIRDYDEIYEHFIRNKEDITKCVHAVCASLYAEDFDEEGMDKLVMLVSGMLWSIEHDALPDDDPESLAYNTWFAIEDFSTGNYDDLFLPDDLVMLKKDVQTLYDYFEAHPSLKG